MSTNANKFFDKTRENAVKTYLNNENIEYTCRKYYISRSSLLRWIKKYDGI